MQGELIKTTADSESLGAKWFSFEELDTIPLRKNLKELIGIYRSHTNFTPIKDFRIVED